MFNSESGGFFMKLSRRIWLVVFLLYAAIVSMLMPTVAGAETGMKLLNDGRPVQVRVSEPAADQNHRDDFGPLSTRKSSKNESSVSKPQGIAGQPLLQLPLRRGIGNTNPGIFGISNFVDLDENHPDSLLDYACGERTYDTEDFDHNGIDYSVSEYSWFTMANEGLIVVAAADGTIVERIDGEPDQQCGFSDDAEANYIVLQHEDGSFTIYAHMKKDTVTARKVGDRVEAGDYLGVVGSSGLSTGPASAPRRVRQQGRLDRASRGCMQRSQPGQLVGGAGGLLRQEHQRDQHPQCGAGISTLPTTRSAVFRTGIHSRGHHFSVLNRA